MHIGGMPLTGCRRCATSLCERLQSLASGHPMGARTDKEAGPRLISAEADVTPAVLAAFAGTPDVRLKEIMAAAAVYLHRFILEVRPTETEFETALRWVAALGRHTTEAHNETVLA